jgi:ribosomal subunit interface protein
MRTTVTARHCEIPGELRERAESQLAKVARMATRPQRAEVVFDVDHGRRVVELQLVLPQGRVKVARAEADDFHTALDAAADKLRSQVGKNARAPARGKRDRSASGRPARR